MRMLSSLRLCHAVWVGRTCAFIFINLSPAVIPRVVPDHPSEELLWSSFLSTMLAFVELCRGVLFHPWQISLHPPPPFLPPPPVNKSINWR